MLKASRNLILLCLLVLLASGCELYKTSGEPASIQNKTDAPPTETNQSIDEQSCKTEGQSKPADGIVTRADIAERGERIEDFIPETAKLIERTEGDLNGDGEPDAAIVLVGNDKTDYAADDEEYSGVFLNRYLVILIRSRDGGLKRDAVSRKIIFSVPGIESANIASTKIELKISDNLLFLKQANGLSAGTVAEYEHTIKKVNGGWRIISARVAASDIKSDKTLVVNRKQSIAFDDFDIETIKIDFDNKKIKLD